MFFEDTGDAVRDEIPLMRALKRKHPSRYGDLPLPYVVLLARPSRPSSIPPRTGPMCCSGASNSCMAMLWARAGCAPATAYGEVLAHTLVIAGSRRCFSQASSPHGLSLRRN